MPHMDCMTDMNPAQLGPPIDVAFLMLLISSIFMCLGLNVTVLIGSLDDGMFWFQN